MTLTIENIYEYVEEQKRKQPTGLQHPIGQVLLHPSAYDLLRNLGEDMSPYYREKLMISSDEKVTINL